MPEHAKMAVPQLARRRFLAGAGAVLMAGRAAATPLPEADANPFARRDPDGGLSRRPAARPMPSPDALIAAAGLPGVVGYAAVDAMTGELVAANCAGAMAPASTLKAITAAYALDRLGPGHRFRTRVIRSGDMLILAGGGDPRLDTDDLAELAAMTAAAVTTPPMRFTVWGGALPHVDELAPEQDDHLAFNPALSGMMLNFNRVHLGWQAGGAGLTAEARADRHSPRAYSVAASAGPGTLFGYRADDRREYWRVSPAGMRRAGSRWMPVRKPELYAGDVFQTLCRAQGLALPAPEVLDDLPAGPEIAALDSPPLTDILADMLAYSTNLTAEAVGLAASGAPDQRASAAAMAQWLQGQGVAGDFTFADHSGLSPDSRISPEAMARMMAGPGRVAGLADLMKPDPLAEDLGRAPGLRGEVTAKTGTLNFVSNLAGYAEMPGGPKIAFAVFCADEPRRAASAGQELPDGVIGWTRRAKTLQRGIVESLVTGHAAG